MSKSFALLAVLLVMVLFASCSNQPATTPTATSPKTNTITFTDATNTTITLSKQPGRIACLVAISEDILAELVLQPVAVNDTFGQDPQFFPDKAMSLMNISRSFFDLHVYDISQ